MYFQIIGQISMPETIAQGRGIRCLALLKKKYGAGNWKKCKGFANIDLLDTGEVCYAEIHWYEAHGIGKKDFKIKKFIR